MYVDLDTIKKQLNLEPDFVEDDEYLIGLLEVAENAVEVHVNRSFAEIADKSGGCLPPCIRMAIVLYAANLYQRREPIGNADKELPLSYTYLINLYQDYNN